MRQELHHHSHCFFVVTWHPFSKSCYFSSQKHGFPFLARFVVLLLSFAIATCAIAAARSKFSLNPFRQNLREIIGTFERHIKGPHSNLARRATQGYAVQLRRVIRRAMRSAAT